MGPRIASDTLQPVANNGELNECENDRILSRCLFV